MIGALLLTACTPEITPPWLIDRPTDLGMRIDVESLGPLSEPLEGIDNRPYHEALPFDTIRATPLLVDANGPIPQEDTSFVWVRCAGFNCRDALLAEDLPDCADTLLADACTLGVGPTMTLDIANLPEPQSPDPLGLLSSISIAAIGSARERDAASCHSALRARKDLSGCFILLRSATLGPLDGLIDYARSLGYEIDDDELAPLVRMLPRNRVPYMENVTISGSSAMADSALVPNGGRITVHTGDVVSLSWEPDEEDRQTTEIERDDGTTLTYMDGVFARWWTTERATDFEFLPFDSRATWSVGNEPGEAHIYATIVDNKGAESLAWFEVDVLE